MFVNKHFINISGIYNSRILRNKNAKFSGRDFQICISVPLILYCIKIVSYCNTVLILHVLGLISELTEWPLCLGRIPEKIWKRWVNNIGNQHQSQSYFHIKWQRFLNKAYQASWELSEEHAQWNNCLCWN